MEQFEADLVLAFLTPRERLVPNKSYFMREAVRHVVDAVDSTCLDSFSRLEQARSAHGG